jgi:co-chaperonin GroES (HSP10)
MSRKLYSSRIVPLDERILIRVLEQAATKTSLVVAEAGVEPGKFDVKSVPASKKKNVGIVVEIGPGARGANGERIPIDPNITPGAEVHFEVVQGAVPVRPPAMAEEMEKEGLWFIIESQVVCVVRPEGVVAARKPVLA